MPVYMAVQMQTDIDIFSFLKNYLKLLVTLFESKLHTKIIVRQ